MYVLKPCLMIRAPREISRKKGWLGMPYPIEDLVCCLANLLEASCCVWLHTHVWMVAHGKRPERLLDFCMICIPLYPQHSVGVYSSVFFHSRRQC